MEGWGGSPLPEGGRGHRGEPEEPRRLKFLTRRERREVARTQKVQELCGAGGDESAAVNEIVAGVRPLGEFKVTRETSDAKDETGEKYLCTWKFQSCPKEFQYSPKEIAEPEEYTLVSKAHSELQISCLHSKLDVMKNDYVRLWSRLKVLADSFQTVDPREITELLAAVPPPPSEKGQKRYLGTGASGVFMKNISQVAASAARGDRGATAGGGDRDHSGRSAGDFSGRRSQQPSHGPPYRPPHWADRDSDRDRGGYPGLPPTSSGPRSFASSPMDYPPPYIGRGMDRRDYSDYPSRRTDASPPYREYDPRTAPPGRGFGGTRDSPPGGARSRWGPTTDPPGAPPARAAYDPRSAPAPYPSSSRYQSPPHDQPPPQAAAGHPAGAARRVPPAVGFESLLPSGSAAGGGVEGAGSAGEVLGASAGSGGGGAEHGGWRLEARVQSVSSHFPQNSGELYCREGDLIHFSWEDPSGWVYGEVVSRQGNPLPEETPELHAKTTGWLPRGKSGL
uniref:SH3 domain-containing protein n=1 Tax=Chromera velia CCMP2878 TaxID=1169474 RepID=A0A0G4HSJ1_9ALVE|eukprot:Cvel_8301.t1-p1 / transcript=Cvel_8301.t1 / gene=Cvel_8301 / organism=Chromera_velia_CCMP2878 / gene_product=hypothetical protein / transcript_product=hypothetical protein / location=Cvel_scaffold456:5469-8391(-) / protein_length=506 / sequence_SO=supercontig / SO=protein_coding / is_pseudo=false